MSVWPTLGADPVLESTGGHASSQHYINSTVKASSWRMTLKFIAETVARKLFPCVLNVLLCCAVMWTFWRLHCVQYCDMWHCCLYVCSDIRPLKIPLGILRTFLGDAQTLTVAVEIFWRIFWPFILLLFSAPLWSKLSETDGLTGWTVVVCRHSPSVNFYLKCFFSVTSRLILMKLGVNDIRAKGYKVAELISNICIN